MGPWDPSCPPPQASEEEKAGQSDPVKCVFVPRSTSLSVSVRTREKDGSLRTSGQGPLCTRETRRSGTTQDSKTVLGSEPTMALKCHVPILGRS